MKQDQIVEYLEKQDIVVQPVTVLPSFFDPKNEIKGRQAGWTSLGKQTDKSLDLTNLQAESMSLASMAAVEQLKLQNGDKLLDTCAAPGMKSLYAANVAKVELCSNDLSADRIRRLKSLLAKHGVEATITKQDATKLHELYEPESFDKILIDAPCSGEGVALAGDIKQAEAWSSAKVKRLQQLQVKILKSAWSLLKPNGRLVYATCTLNLNENERAVRKALGVTLRTNAQQLSLEEIPLLKSGEAIRILPSNNSIGFFVARLDKSEED